MLKMNRFLGVDALWALCMAVNVYFALFRGWTAQRMRAQEWKYIVGCYGAVSLPQYPFQFRHLNHQGYATKVQLSKAFYNANLWT